MVSTQNIVPRSALIPGYRTDAFTVPAQAPPDPVIQTASVTLSRAEVHDLDSTAIDIVVAIPNRKIAVLGVYASKTGGGFTGGDDVTLNFKDGSTTLVATLRAAFWRTAGAAAEWAVLPATTGALADFDYPVEGIDASTGTTFAGAGGGTTLTVLYVEVT